MAARTRSGAKAGAVKRKAKTATIANDAAQPLPLPFTRERIPRLVADFTSQSVDRIYQAVNGTTEKAMLLARFEVQIGGPSAEAVGPILALWNAASPKEQYKMTIDQLCDASGFTRADMVALLARYTYKAGADVIEMFFAANMPYIVAEALEDSLSRKDAIGHDMRKELMRARGILPSNKNTQVINVHATAQSVAAQSAEAFGLPSFEESIKASAMTLLPESSAELADLAVDAEYATVEADQ